MASFLPSKRMVKKSENRLLIVDDESQFRYSLSLALKKAGFETFQAEDGRQALEMLLTAQRVGKPYDLILLDLQMPRMNGLELVQELFLAGIKTPVFFVSAFLDEGTRASIAESGCVGILEKPFEPEEIVKRVKGCLQGNGREEKR